MGYATRDKTLTWRSIIVCYLIITQLFQEKLAKTENPTKYEQSWSFLHLPIIVEENRTGKKIRNPGKSEEEKEISSSWSSVRMKLDLLLSLLSTRKGFD